MSKQTLNYSVKLDPKSEKNKVQYIVIEDENPKNSTMNEEVFQNFILQKYASANQQIKSANISYSNFKQYAHNCFSKIKNLVQSKKLQLNVKNLFLEAKFCYLYQDDAHFIEDLLSTFLHDLENLSMNLIGNYLSLYGLSQILKSISRLFPKLSKLTIDFSQVLFIHLQIISKVFYLNSICSYAQLHKVDLKKFDGFLDIIKLSNLKSIDFNLSQTSQFSNFFQCLKNPQIFPSNLREISLDCQQMQDGLNENLFENFSYIFQRLPQLESLDLNFQNSYLNGILTLLNALKDSHLQKLVLNLYKSTLNQETPSYIMKILFQSQHLKYLDVNFRMAARNQADCLEIFQDLHRCSSLEVFYLSLQNNDIENYQLMTFADHFSKTPKNLKKIYLNLTNDYKQKRLSQEYVNHLEYPILQIPYLTEASISFTEAKIEKYSQRLKQYSLQVKASIYQNIAFKKLISPFMVFNPTFIIQDLFF
ncbi:hypothetical protein ABPG72_018883 [Tetrahymena utriculariae]